MKCLAKTSRWGVKPCPNNAKCDGYCYAHHPSVVLAKLRLYEREGRTHLRDYVKENGHVVGEPGPSISEEIAAQEALLNKLSESNRKCPACGGIGAEFLRDDGPQNTHVCRCRTVKAPIPVDISDVAFLAGHEAGVSAQISATHHVSHTWPREPKQDLAMWKARMAKERQK